MAARVSPSVSCGFRLTSSATESPLCISPLPKGFAQASLIALPYSILRGLDRPRGAAPRHGVAAGGERSRGAAPSTVAPVGVSDVLRLKAAVCASLSMLALFPSQ